jgi:hypothetical protein
MDIEYRWETDVEPTTDGSGANDRAETAFRSRYRYMEYPPFNSGDTGVTRWRRRCRSAIRVGSILSDEHFHE